MAQLNFDAPETTASIRRLVKTVPSSAGANETWPEVLREFFSQPFFTLNLPTEAWSALALLPKYASDMRNACNDLGVDPNKRVEPAKFKAVLNRNTFVTLEQVLAVDHMLNSVAESDYNKLRGRIRVQPPQDNAKPIPFKLPNDCVIPSLYALKKPAFQTLWAQTQAADTGAASKAILGEATAFDFIGCAVHSPLEHTTKKGKIRKVTPRVTKATFEMLAPAISAFRQGKGQQTDISHFLSDRLSGSDLGGGNYSQPLTATYGNIFPPPPQWP